MLSRLTHFEHNELLLTPTTLVPLCRNIPGNHRLRTGTSRDSYHLAMDTISDLITAMGNGIFGDPNLASAAYVSTAADHTELRHAQHGEFGPHPKYLTENDAHLH